MLKITAIGNLTHDVELKMNEATGKPYAILRIASDRRYKDKDGNKIMATNLMLVERAVSAVKVFGKEPATSAEAREILSLGK